MAVPSWIRQAYKIYLRENEKDFRDKVTQQEQQAGSS
jgi:hypothetical protein